MVFVEGVSSISAYYHIQKRENAFLGFTLDQINPAETLGQIKINITS